MHRRAFLASAAAPLWSQTLAPGAPASPERRALIEACEKKLPGLADRFERRLHRPLDGWRLPYRLFRPASGARLPLVLYLHGSGGLGADNQKQFSGGNRFGALVWALPENQKRWPCLVVAPQTDRGWLRYASPRRSDQDRPEKLPGLGEGAAAAVDLVRSLIAEFRCDERRIYVTGNSMGGGGSWHLIAHQGGLFAAAVPYCGAESLETGAENPRLPVWNFHGDADRTVSVEVSRARIAARRQAGGQPLYTEYPGVGHDVSLWAATEPALPEWLFACRR